MKGAGMKGAGMKGAGMKGAGMGAKRRPARAGRGVAGGGGEPEGQSLLRQLAAAGCHAEQRGEALVVLRPGPGPALPSGGSRAVLAALLQSGAIAATSRAGRLEYRITPEGQARLLRETAGGETPFADQHRLIGTRQEAGETLRVNLRESPLELFRRAKTAFSLIGAAELAAADRLRADIDLAQTLPQVSANWSRLGVGSPAGPGGINPSERVVAARARVEAALRAVGPDFSGLLLDVCGFAKGLEMIEKERNLPQRAGKVALGYALRALARHYGFDNFAMGKARGVMRYWGAEEYRPDLGPPGANR